MVNLFIECNEIILRQMSPQLKQENKLYRAEQTCNIAPSMNSLPFCVLLTYLHPDFFWKTETFFIESQQSFMEVTKFVFNSKFTYVN